MLSTRITAAKSSQRRADPQLDAAAAGDLARLGAALGAVAAQRVEQPADDRDHEDRRGDEADPKQGVDLVGARRVRRQSAAILITQGARARTFDRRAALYSPTS